MSLSVRQFRCVYSWRGRIIVDKFHLIRHINGALDEARIRLQGGNRRGKRGDLFRSRYTPCSREPRGLLIGGRQG